MDGKCKFLTLGAIEFLMELTYMAKSVSGVPVRVHAGERWELVFQKA